MASLREFWDEMEDQDEVKDVGGGIAYRSGTDLIWKRRGVRVSTDAIVYRDWTLVKPTPAKIETERWMRDDDVKFAYFCYQGHRRCNIENMKAFLYWGGEDLPYGGRWPRNSQAIWIDSVEKHWASFYNKEAGHTEQLVAGWAVMRKEKSDEDNN